jgi:hypothetical protein
LKRRTTVLVIVAALAAALGLLAGPAMILRYHTRAMMPVVERFVVAAQALDSARFAGVATSSIWSVVRERSLLHGYFENASHGVRPVELAWRGDSAILTASLRQPFPTQECGPISTLRVTLVSVTSDWRIVAFSTGIC